MPYTLGLGLGLELELGLEIGLGLALGLDFKNTQAVWPRVVLNTVGDFWSYNSQ